MVDAFFNGASRLARMHPEARPERHFVEKINDVRYAPGELREHMLDIYRPKDEIRRFPHAAQLGPPWPIVFYVHGGGFRILSKDTHWVMGLGFARRGFLVCNVEYRLAPAHHYPAAIEDVCRAFVWVVENAVRYGGDPSRIVLAGESAGANLVGSLSLALAYRREEPYARAAFDTGVTPRAVIPACGVFQVSDMRRLARRKPHMSRFIVDRLVEVEHAYLGEDTRAYAALDLADPVVVLERGVAPDRPLAPYFLPVGTKDPLLPDTRRFAKRGPRARRRRRGAVLRRRAPRVPRLRRPPTVGPPVLARLLRVPRPPRPRVVTLSDDPHAASRSGRARAPARAPSSAARARRASGPTP